MRTTSKGYVAHGDALLGDACLLSNRLEFSHTSTSSFLFPSSTTWWYRKTKNSRPGTQQDCIAAKIRQKFGPVIKPLRQKEKTIALPGVCACVRYDDSPTEPRGALSLKGTASHRQLLSQHFSQGLLIGIVSCSLSARDKK